MKLFVPIFVNNQSTLFEVSCKASDTPWFCNKLHGMSLKQKLYNYFQEDCNVEISLMNEENLHPDIYESADSASLGILTSCISYIQDRKFNDDYDSITITGDIDKNNLELLPVERIEEKLQALVNYAEGKNECHCFIYIGEDRLDEVLTNKAIELNIRIIRFGLGMTINVVLPEVFQLNSLSQFTSFHQEFKNEHFIQSRNFNYFKQLTLENNSSGLFFEGQSKTGKTRTIYELCKWLAQVDSSYKIQWLSLVNEFNKEPLSDELILDFFNTNIVFEDGKKIIVVIDGIDSKYQSLIVNKYLYFVSLHNEVIYTFFSSRKILDYTIFNSHKIRVINEYNIDYFSLKLFAENLFKKNISKKINTKTDEYFNLLKLIYDRFQNFPYFIIYCLTKLNSISIQNLISQIKTYSLNGYKDFANIIYLEILKTLSTAEKMVLFIYIEMIELQKDYDIELNSFSIRDYYNNRYEELNLIYDGKSNESEYLSEDSIWNVLTNLANKKVLNTVENGFSIIEGLNNFVLLCDDSVLSEEDRFLRSGWLNPIVRLTAMIKNNYPFNEIINSIELLKGETLVLSNLLITASEVYSNSELIDKLLEYGADINFVDQRGFFPLYRALLNRNVNIIKCLYKHNAKEQKISILNTNLDFSTYHFSIKNQKILKENDKLSYLYASILNENSEILEYLLKRGHKPNEAFFMKRTPILFDCYINESIDHFNFLLSYGANLHAVDMDGRNCVHEAVIGRNLEKLKILLNLGLDINKCDCDNMPPIFYAVSQYGNIQMVKILVEKGADTSILDKELCSILHHAMKSNDFEIIEYLIGILDKNGNYLNLKSKNGATPFMVAVATCNIKIIEYLLKFNINIFATDNNHRNIFFYSAINKNIEVLKYFIDYYRKNNIELKTDPFTLKYCLAHNSSIEVINHLFIYLDKINNIDIEECLLASIDNKNSNILTLVLNKFNFDGIKNFKTNPITYAIHNNRTIALETLLDYENLNILPENNYLNYACVHAIDPEILTILDKHGYNISFNYQTKEITPLKLIVMHNSNPAVLEKAIELGANIEEIDLDGNSLIHYAAKNPNSQMIEYLSTLYNLECQNFYSETPLYYLIESERDSDELISKIKTLISLGADFECKNNHDINLMHVAVGQGKIKVFEYLLSLGLNPYACDAVGENAFSYQKNILLRNKFLKIYKKNH